MSEPVSNAEIEDVLSSIRRLVSGDVVASQEIASITPVQQLHSAKLILTPAFRVIEPSDNKNDEVLVLEADATASDPVDFHHVENSEENSPEPSGDETDDVWPISFEHGSVADPVPEEKPSLEKTIAELEAAIGRQNGVWEPDGSGFVEDVDAEEVLSEPVIEWSHRSGEETEIDDFAPVDEKTDEEIVEDGDYSPEDTTAADPQSNDDSMIDEEVMREFIGDIVRQELQGALGERITRNVRKLVRREINRVLASQDFD